MMMLLCGLLAAQAEMRVASNLLGESVNYELFLPKSSAAKGAKEVVLLVPDVRHGRGSFEHLAQTISVPSASMDLRGVKSNKALGLGASDAPLMHIDLLAVSKQLEAEGYTRQSCVGLELGGTLCAQAMRAGAAIERIAVVSPQVAVAGQSLVVALGEGRADHVMIMMGDDDISSNHLSDQLDQRLVGIRYEVVDTRARGKELLIMEPRLEVLLRHWIHRSPELDKTVHDLPRGVNAPLPEPELQRLTLPDVELPEVRLEGANPDAARLKELMREAPAEQPKSEASTKDPDQ